MFPFECQLIVLGKDFPKVISHFVFSPRFHRQCISVYEKLKGIV